MILINFWAFPVFTLRLTLIFFPGLTVSLEAVTERLESEVFILRMTNDPHNPIMTYKLIGNLK